MSKTKWILTDSDTKQYGRQLEDKVFEFKEKGKEKSIINLVDYSEKEIEKTINSYGYTLFKSKPHLNNIKTMYGKSANWVIAECLFEMDM